VPRIRAIPARAASHDGLFDVDAELLAAAGCFERGVVFVGFVKRELSLVFGGLVGEKLDAADFGGAGARVPRETCSEDRAFDDTVRSVLLDVHAGDEVAVEEIDVPHVPLAEECAVAGRPSD
jgi:hypothetical protein